MYIIIGLIITCYIGLVAGIIFHYDESKFKMIIHMLKVPILSSIFPIIMFSIKSNSRRLLQIENNNETLIYYMVASMFILFVDGFLTKKLYPSSAQISNESKLNKKQKLASMILLTLSYLIFFATNCSIHTFGETTLEQTIINVIGQKAGTSMDVIFDIVVVPLIYTFIASLLTYIFIYSKYEISIKAKHKDIHIFTNKSRRITALTLSIIMIIFSIVDFGYQYNIYKIYNIFKVESNYIEQNYINPNDVNIKFPDNKRNLIHIYLESVENTYFSKELGGNMDIDLMPELATLTQEGYNFSHLDKGFGGFQSSTGGQWSVASMINMYGGLPMKVPSTLHYYNSQDAYLPNTTMLGDILNSEGYNQSVMFGSNSEFGGLIHLYTKHGNYKMIDYNTAKRDGLIPKDYKVWWGFEDDKLYEFAKDEITKLSQSGKPFNFTMETADTHFPDGYKCENVKDEFESQYANVIKYSQAQTVEFIRWIQAQPFYENTTIVITGDHLSMDANFFKQYVDKSYLRTSYNLILNPSPELTSTKDNRFHNRLWANFDMFPTILSSLGVEIEGDRLGLGTDLFSDNPTLFERDGVEYVNGELEKHSDFYCNEIAVTAE